MSNPFLPWLPMYGPGAVPERPWWQLCTRGGVTLDTYPAQYPWQAVRDGRAIALGYAGAASARGLITPAIVEEIDRIDTEHPLPVPPPMPTQVWCWSPTEMATVVDIHEGRPVWNGGIPPAPYQRAAERARRGRWEDDRRRARMATGADKILFAASSVITLDDYAWPPPGAILVAGPLAPWAPAGWAP